MASNMTMTKGKEPGATPAKAFNHFLALADAWVPGLLEDRGTATAIGSAASASNSAISVSSLNGDTGFRLVGASHAVSSAGDINGDGFDDVIVSNGNNDSYLVFGQASGVASSIDLSQLDGSTGFRLHLAGGQTAVSSAGDVNGDGFGDLIVGGWNNFGNSHLAYVVFGQASGFAAQIDLNSVDGNTGFRIDSNLGFYDSFGDAVSAGDINGDGFSDLIVGDPGYYGLNSACYVVFGRASGFAPSIDALSLDSGAGFRIDGWTNWFDGAGTNVSSGDINGDGFNDVIIGTAGQSHSYVVYGQEAGLASPTKPLSLNGATGFRVGGAAVGAADFNGDGIDDLIVERGTGSSYVVYGHTAEFDSWVNLSHLDGSTGFRVDAPKGIDYFNFSVKSAGDCNGDGFDDLIIGATTFHGGASYLVYGHASGGSSSINLSSLDGDTGFRLEGTQYTDALGWSVNAAGDVNGDGFDDLIVSAQGTDSSYVMFGGDFTGAVTYLGSNGADNLHGGTSAAERFVAGNGNDTMQGGGGADVFNGGQGNDTIAVADLNFQLADGGNGWDALALAGAGLTLDLANFRGRIESIEAIDLTGSGNNTLVMTGLDVRGLSDNSNQLQVDGNAGDHYSLSGSGWAPGSDVVLVGATYHTFDNGQAHVLINSALTAV